MWTEKCYEDVRVPGGSCSQWISQLACCHSRTSISDRFGGIFVSFFRGPFLFCGARGLGSVDAGHEGRAEELECGVGEGRKTHRHRETKKAR